MGDLSKRERLRRVVLLCAHFARNLAYHRAAHDALVATGSQFWITADGNFVDMAVIEWCKLFGDDGGRHSWINVVGDTDSFKADLLANLNMTPANFDAFVKKVRRYRDKFLAHLDDERIMDIPSLDDAYSAVKFYHNYIVRKEASAGDLGKLPEDLSEYYDHCVEEAKDVLIRCGIQR